MNLLATAGGFGPEGPASHHLHALVAPDSTRNFVLMVVLVAALVAWLWWRIDRVP